MLDSFIEYLRIILTSIVEGIGENIGNTVWTLLIGKYRKTKEENSKEKD